VVCTHCWTLHQRTEEPKSNKLAVYFVADTVLADIDFPGGRYGFFVVADIVLVWPIWFVADMVAPRKIQV